MNRFKPRRRAVLAFIHGRAIPPTLLEIAGHVGCDGAAVAFHVGWLERLGYLARRPRFPRGLSVTDAGRAALEASSS